MNVRALIRDEGGAVALAVALMLPVLIGVGAFAVDVSHSRLVKNRLQSAADAGALAGVQWLTDQPTARAKAVEFAGVNVPEGFGAVTEAADVEFGSFDPANRSFTPSNVAVNAMRVRTVREAARDNAAPRFLAAIWGDAPITISASAIAAREITSVAAQPSELIVVDPTAGDFNEVHAYCFDYAGAGPAASRRTQMVKVAHNITAKVPAFVWPNCAPGQSLSFRLYNVRGARKAAQANKAPPASPPAKDVFNHYSDTVIENGRETFNFGGKAMLETLRCDTFEECKNPPIEGATHVANKEERPCVPGKFMYYGWEDRPPPNGDRDYNDIVFVLTCPTGASVTYGAARLVR